MSSVVDCPYNTNIALITARDARESLDKKKMALFMSDDER
jgi:hypothetical protein